MNTNAAFKEGKERRDNPYSFEVDEEQYISWEEWYEGFNSYPSSPPKAAKRKDTREYHRRRVA